MADDYTHGSAGKREVEPGLGQGGYGSGYGPGAGPAHGSFGSGQSWEGEGRHRQGGYGGSSGFAQYAGRGPKNYRRSDERIREDVNEELTRHPELDAGEVEVQVQQCEVTLTGFVDSRRAKRLAEDLAEGVSGVTEVHNHLRVQSGGESTTRGGSEQQNPGEAGSRSARGTGTRA